MRWLRFPWLRRQHARWRSLPPNMRGVVWAVLSGFMFSFMSLFIKTLSGSMNPLEIAWLRALFGLLLVLPFLPRYGRSAMRTRRLGSHFLRSCLASASTMLGFYSVALLPLATATALSFVRPLFMVPLAIVFLKEVVRLRRWIATIVGFGGVIVVMRPDAGIEFAAIFGLSSAFAAALSQIMTKRLTATEPVPEMMFFNAVFTTLITAGPALFVWETPTLHQLFLAAVIAATGSVGQLWLIWSLAEGEATLTGPMEYLRILFAAGFGFFVFGEVPTVWTGVGVLIIVASTLYIAWREAQLRSQRQAPR